MNSTIANGFVKLPNPFRDEGGRLPIILKSSAPQTVLSINPNHTALEQKIKDLNEHYRNTYLDYHPIDPKLENVTEEQLFEFIREFRNRWVTNNSSSYSLYDRDSDAEYWKDICSKLLALFEVAIKKQSESATALVITTLSKLAVNNPRNGISEKNKIASSAMAYVFDKEPLACLTSLFNECLNYKCDTGYPAIVDLYNIQRQRLVNIVNSCFLTDFETTRSVIESFSNASSGYRDSESVKQIREFLQGLSDKAIKSLEYSEVKERLSRQENLLGNLIKTCSDLFEKFMPKIATASKTAKSEENPFSQTKLAPWNPGIGIQLYTREGAPAVNLKARLHETSTKEGGAQ